MYIHLTQMQSDASRLVMISNQDNCLFIHIPKVAGQSIEQVFLQRAGLTWAQREKFLLKHNKDKRLGPPRLAHLTAQEYCELGYISKAEFERYIKFSFVRNPWQRILSEYLYRQYPFSFNDFIFKYFPTPIDDDFDKGMDAYRHIIPQHKFICDEDDQLLVDYVGKFENIINDFSWISHIITGEKLSLPHRNKTTQPLSKLTMIKSKIKYFNKKHYLSSRNYKEYYDNDTKLWVEEYYKKDIELFGYTY